MSPSEKLLDQHYNSQVTEQTNSLEDKLLKENKISREQWLSFLEMVKNLELNRDGANILFEEVKNGRVVLPS